MIEMNSFWLRSRVVYTSQPSHAKVQQGKVNFTWAAA
jgi:hypothetical protein